MNYLFHRTGDVKYEGDNELKDINKLSSSEPVPPVLSHGNCLKAGTTQAPLYHRDENLLYKTDCSHSPRVSCASVEPSEVYQTDDKIPHSMLLKTIDKRKQWKASYTFSRDHKFMYPVNLLFRSFNFAVALRINFISRTGSSICTKIFYLRYLQAGTVGVYHSNIDLQEVSKLILKKPCFSELAKMYLKNLTCIGCKRPKLLRKKHYVLAFSFDTSFVSFNCPGGAGRRKEKKKHKPFLHKHTLFKTWKDKIYLL